MTTKSVDKRLPWREIWGSVGFVERNFALVKRYIGWEIVFLVYTAVNAVTIGLIGTSTGDERMVIYLVVGAILWGFLSVLFHEISESIAWEQWEGTLEITFMAPVKRLSQLLGTAMYAILYGVIRSAFILGALAIFFRIDLTQANLLVALVILLVSGVAFIGMGLAAAVLPLLSRERGPQATHIFQALILLVSGVYYPITVLPVWIQPLSRISPATYTLRSMRAAILDGAGFGEVWKDIVYVAVTAIILVPTGLVIFWIGEKWAKKTGKLKIEG
jgi:ABC-2 type transport system permease protein